jgi:membrane protein implicated in regulation of membrane protease activity
LGKSWLGALLFSLFVSAIFSQVFSLTIELGFWIGIAIFLVALLLFLWIIIRVSRRRGAEQVSQSAEFRRIQAYDFKDEDD